MYPLDGGGLHWVQVVVQDQLVFQALVPLGRDQRLDLLSKLAQVENEHVVDDLAYLEPEGEDTLILLLLFQQDEQLDDELDGDDLLLLDEGGHESVHGGIVLGEAQQLEGQVQQTQVLLTPQAPGVQLQVVLR